MFEYCEDKLGILAEGLYPEFMTYKMYNHRLYRGTIIKPKLKLLQKGGKGRKAIVEWEGIDKELKAQIIEKYGDPKSNTAVKFFTDKIERGRNSL